MLLSVEDMTIGEVSNQFDMTRGAIKKHLKILEEGNLISVHPRGRERINHLEPLGIKSAADWLNYFNQFWDSKLTALGNAIKNNTENNND
jgi:DNA-binding MarR family transcriptional regulator